MTNLAQEVDISDLFSTTKIITDPDAARGLAIFATFQLNQLIEDLSEYFGNESPGEEFVPPMKDKVKAIQWFIDRTVAEAAAKAGVWE